MGHYRAYERELSLRDRKVCAEAENEAREAKRGIRTDPTVVPPWEFRHGATNSSRPAGAIVDNKNSRIFHTLGCSGYNSVSAKNRVVFGSTAEAEAVGYRAAKNCISKGCSR